MRVAGFFCDIAQVRHQKETIGLENACLTTPSSPWMAQNMQDRMHWNELDFILTTDISNNLQTSAVQSSLQLWRVPAHCLCQLKAAEEFRARHATTWGAGPTAQSVSFGPGWLNKHGRSFVAAVAKMPEKLQHQLILTTCRTACVSKGVWAAPSKWGALASFAPSPSMPLSLNIATNAASQPACPDIHHRQQPYASICHMPLGRLHRPPCA